MIIPLRRFISAAASAPILLRNKLKDKSVQTDGSLKAFKAALLSSGDSRNGDLFRIYNKIYSDGKINILSHEDHTQMLTLMVMHKNFDMASHYVGNIIENMIDNNHTLYITDHYLCLAVYLKARKYQLVVDHFDSIKPIYHLKPCARCYNLKMAALCYANDLNGLTATWKEFVTDYPHLRHLNQDGYAFLIEGFGRAGNIEEALHHYRHLLSKFPSTDDPTKLSIPLSAPVHVAMIRAFGFCGKGEQSIELFNKYLSKVDELSNELIYCYDAIIQALFDAGNTDLALEFYSRISEICEVYNESIAGKENLNHASPILDTLERVIGYHASVADSPKIVQVYKSNHHVSGLNTETKEIVIRAMLNEGLLEEAEDLFHEMIKFSQAPSVELQVEFGYDPESGFSKRI